MKKEKEAMKRERMKDEGFSLVELIIVLAMMAVLVVVLAPQYLKYLERARNSADLQNARTIVNAIQIYAADPQANPPITFDNTNGAKITIHGNGTPSTIEDDNASVAAALDNAGLEIDNMYCASKTAWTGYTITVKVETDGSISFTYQGEGSADANIDAFADMMTGAVDTGDQDSGGGDGTT